MADSSQQDKAAKLAAARKRFEELKRKKQPAKKTEEKQQSVTGIESAKTTSDAELGISLPEAMRAESGDGGTHENLIHSPIEDPIVDIESSALSDSTPTSILATRDAGAPNEDKNGGQGRRQSVALMSPGLYTGELSPGTLPDIYRKQASTINDLRVERQQLLEEITSLREEVKLSKEIMVARDSALEDLASTSEELNTLKVRLGADQATVREGAGELQRLNAEISSLRRQLSHSESQAFQKEKTIAELRRDSTTDASSRLENSVKSKEVQLENMSVEISELQEALSRSKSREEGLSSECMALRSQVETLRTDVSKANGALDELKGRLTAANNSVLQETTARSSYGLELQTKDTVISELRSQVTKLEATIKELKNSQLTSQESKQSLETRNKDIGKKLINYQRENGDLQTRLADLKSKLQESMKESRRLNEQLMANRGRIRRDSEVHLKNSKAEPQGNIAENAPQFFSDVDLRMATEINIPDRISDDTSFVGDPFNNNKPSRKAQERQYFSDQIKRELRRWSGYKLDIRDIWTMYDTTESRIFET